MMGPKAEGCDGEEEWPGSIQNAIAILHDKGLTLGVDVASVQNYQGKFFYYAHGDASGACAEDAEAWSFTVDRPFKTIKAGGENVGPHLPGSPMKPEGSWPGSLEAAIKIVQGEGYEMGTGCCAIQNYKGYLCFYGPGDESSGTGAETWKFEASPKCVPAGGSMVGKHLEGSPLKPEGSWPGSIEEAIKMVEGMGFALGRECVAIQNYKGYLCFYGPGEDSGESGAETWRFE